MTSCMVKRDKCRSMSGIFFRYNEQILQAVVFDSVEF